MRNACCTTTLPERRTVSATASTLCAGGPLAIRCQAATANGATPVRRFVRGHGHLTYDSWLMPPSSRASYRFNDQFKITAGFRWTEDHKEGWQTWRVVNFDSISTAPGWGSATPALDITAIAACNQVRLLRLREGVSRRRPHDDNRRDRRRSAHPERHLERTDRCGRPRLDARFHHAVLCQVQPGL